MTSRLSERARAELYRRRAELLHIHADLAEAEAGMAGAGTEPDFTDRASATEVSSQLDRLDAAGRRELTEIEAAIARLDAGTYGQCERCAGPITEARLLALPEARICIACAQLDEDRARPLRRRV